VFGVSGQELVIIAIIAVILLGPERIPQVARGLARAYRELTKVRRQVDTTIGELKSELKLDELELDEPELKPPPGKRVPLDQLHAMDDILKPEEGRPSSSPEPLEVPPEDDYLA
jgi:Sec-independent protein translocase protein TatA